ncbi:MAG: homocysteine S-methyltransferase family protein [Coriobacteriia bacterium]|nr:homocysteine S-methyltransferase family protein [Coriobacteriia bacterium]
MPDIKLRLGREVLVIDGALGTMIQRYEVPEEQCKDQLNLTAPEMIEQIARDYVTVGAECITTNTFGSSRVKLSEYGVQDQLVEINRAGVEIARRAGAQHVLGDIGPTGLVLQPLGEARFDDLFEIFAEQAAALASASPDALVIETMTDIAEARCALLAAKSVCDLPVFVTCTFGINGRMDLSGTDPATAAVILEAAGADAVGMNCGLGPEQMLPLVQAMAAATSLPIIVQPNAGLPQLVDGETVFPGTPDEMGSHAALFVDAGASMVGSCCGSSPAFTGAIMDFAKSKTVSQGRTGLLGTVLAGPRGIATIGAGAPIAVIGERINPTGKPALADSLRLGSMSVVRSFAVEQHDAGATLLDVNVGAAGVDALAVLPEAIKALVGTSDLPLVIDTTDPIALEAALRVYPGRALINSVNGGADSLAIVLPLASRYGAAMVVLALDDGGIPHDVDGRVAIVERVRAAAHAAGLRDCDLVVDALVMTAATDADAPRVTVATLAAAHALGLATVLGVSNVSHGLPDRPSLNAAFIAAAAAAGLDAGIINPSDGVVMQAVRLADVARAGGVSSDAHEDAWPAWDAAYAAALARAKGPAGTQDTDAAAAHVDSRSAADRLSSAIDRGDGDAAGALVDAVIAEGTDPAAVIGMVLTPAIQRLGDAYGRGEVFLPQLMIAADAMKAAVAQVKTYLPEGDGSGEGRVAFATVKGDIHSIGKDICISLLESQGFVVTDLGVDVAEDAVVEAAGAADVVCLSALMTTTLPAMERTTARVAVEVPGTPVLVGGAVVTAQWAGSIGAGYSSDAPGCVEAVRAAVAGVREGGKR